MSLSTGPITDPYVTCANPNRPDVSGRQVNQTPTTEHDCCHIVPLIASVGDRLDLVVARNPLTEEQPQLEVRTGGTRGITGTG